MFCYFISAHCVLHIGTLLSVLRPCLCNNPFFVVERTMPGEDGSGDMEGLPKADLTRPPVGLELSPLWLKAPPEVRYLIVT